MEIKRKTISDEQLFARENELIAEVNSVCDGFHDRFSSLGYELNIEIDEKKSDDFEFSPRKKDEDPKPEYKPGYACRATVTVRRPKSDEEIEKDEELEEEIAEAEKEIAEKTDDGDEYGIDEQLAEQERNDAILAEAEDKLNRSVAYTQLMLTRVYKAFWVEKVSICDNTDELRADLEEFYEKLSSGEAGSEE